MIASNTPAQDKEFRLSERRLRFVNYYVDTGNASESARLAGYAEDSAGVEGCKLLKNPRVKALVDKLYKEKFDLNREQYQAEALRRSQTCKQESVQKGYYELYGKAKGYLQDNNTNVLILNNLDTDLISSKALSKTLAPQSKLTNKQVTE